MKTSKQQAIIVLPGVVVIFLLSVFTVVVASSEYALAVNDSATSSLVWEYEEECEYPDEHTVGRTIPRSNASAQLVHGQFGCEETSGYPAKSGFVIYKNINLPQINDLYLKVRYSKHGSSGVPIDIYIDDELKTSFTPVNTGNWNVFTTTEEIHLGSIDRGIHTIKFFTEGQQYCVADLDAFTLLSYESPEFLNFLPLIKHEADSWAENRSTSTTCAEEDNIDVPLFAPHYDRYKVIATHPTYDIGADNCEADFSGCITSEGFTADTCTEIHNDGTNIIQECVVAGWWRPYTMDIIVEESIGSYYYLTLSRKIDGENSWPQSLVLYQDGYMRLKPHPPEGRKDTCFGSSVIVGPAAPSSRPFTDIDEVKVNIPDLSLDLTYREGGTAHIDLSVDRSQAVAMVSFDYSTSKTIPFATFRSMYITDGNADVDHVLTPLREFPILNGWATLKGPWWFFYRAIKSVHNTSAPDIRLEVLD